MPRSTPSLGGDPVATGLSLPSILGLGAGSYERRGPYFSDKNQGLYVVRPQLQ